MVLQRNQQNRVWGWGEVGDRVTVNIAGQSKNTQVDDQGRWQVRLDAMPAGGPHRMVVQGDNQITFDNVMVGEVWICSGQSNMAWAVQQANDPDLESLTADFPDIRLISVPRVGTDQPQRDFDGAWEICTPDTVKQFSAVGYFFGRRIHQTLNVPVGLIDNAWGGSACEAWINRDLLEGDERFGELMRQWRETEDHFKSGAAAEAFEAELASWREAAEKAKAAGEPAPRKPRLDGSMSGNQRPANIYNGVLKPTIGFGIRGVIWYQGESNARRAYQYRDLFPLMISNWRDEWQQGDFPFYYVQLADFRAETAEPAESDWAELREAQTMTMSKLPNTGEAVILDLGEASDIHPKNKQDVAKRLARWALAKDYGFDLVYRSPIYRSMEQQEGSIIVTFDHVGGGLDTFDVREPIGFTIAGEDRVFHHASAEFVGQGPVSQVKVWSPDVPSPMAVRYAWADNPICNVQNREGLPLTPFRTDDWPGVTANQTTR
jgi:sialate O-acetylesterase